MACLWRSQIPKSYLLFILRVVVESYYCCSNFPFPISQALPYHFHISIGTLKVLVKKCLCILVVPKAETSKYCAVSTYMHA